MSVFRLDLTNETRDDIESDGRVPAGYYRAMLNDVRDDEETDSTSLEFVVVGGKFDGGKIWHRFNDPNQADSEKKAKNILRQVKIFASRMGLISDNHFGNEVDVDFREAIGWEGIIHVQTRSFTDNDGNKREFTGLEFAGIWPENHHKLPDEACDALSLPRREKPGKSGPGLPTGNAGGNSPSPAGAGAGAPASDSSKVDLSDL